MARSERVLVAFNRGEVSPLLDARSDMAQMASAARTLTNMVVEPQGGVIRRAGTRYIAAQRGFEPGGAGELVVYDYIETSGVAGGKVWSLNVAMTLSPFAEGLEQRAPALLINGTLSGSIILMGWQINDADDNTPYQNIYEGFGGAPSQRTDGYFGATWDGNPPLTYPDFGSIHYVFPGTYDLTPGTYYRFKAFGQVDPFGEYGNFVYSNWFTVDGGFKPDGFTPP